MPGRLVPVVAGALALVALAFLAHDPPTWFYALGWAADLSPALHAFWIACSVALLVIAASPRLASRISQFARPVPTFVLMAVPLVACAFAFRSAVHFWGDGWLILTFIEEDAPKRLRPGILTIHFMRALYRGLLAFDVPNAAENAFLVAGIGAALLTAYALARLVRVTGAPWLGPLALTTAAVQLFFGYVENYTLATAFLALWVARTLEEVGEGRRPALSWLWLAAGALAHASVLLVLPLQILRYFPAPWRVRLAFLTAPFFFAAVPTVTEFGIPGYFLPWTMVRSGHLLGILSEPHFRFVVNLFLWFVPAVLVFLVWTIGRVGPRDDSDAAGVVRSAAGEREKWAFAIALLWVAFCVTVRPWLGARDWDLVSWCSFPLAIAVGLRMLRLSRDDRATLTWSTLAVGFVFVFPWIAGNGPGGRGEDRVARLVVNDVHHFLHGKKAHLPRLAWLFFEQGREDLGRMLYEESVRRVPNAPIGRGNWGILCWLDGNYAEAEENLAVAAETLDDSPPIHYYLGASRFHLQKLDLGERDFLTFLELDPRNPSGASYLGRVYLVTGRWHEAVDQLLVAYEQFPADADLNYWIARAQYGAKNYGQAREFATRALRLRPGFEEAERILRATE